MVGHGLFGIAAQELVPPPDARLQGFTFVGEVVGQVSVESASVVGELVASTAAPTVPVGRASAPGKVRFGSEVAREGLERGPRVGLVDVGVVGVRDELVRVRPTGLPAAGQLALTRVRLGRVAFVDGVEPLWRRSPGGVAVVRLEGRLVGRSRESRSTTASSSVGPACCAGERLETTPSRCIGHGGSVQRGEGGDVGLRSKGGYDGASRTRPWTS